MMKISNVEHRYYHFFFGDDYFDSNFIFYIIHPFRLIYSDTYSIIRFLVQVHQESTDTT